MNDTATRIRIIFTKKLKQRHSLTYHKYLFSFSVRQSITDHWLVNIKDCTRDQDFPSSSTKKKYQWLSRRDQTRNFPRSLQLSRRDRVPMSGPLTFKSLEATKSFLSKHTLIWTQGSPLNIFRKQRPISKSTQALFFFSFTHSPTLSRESYDAPNYIPRHTRPMVYGSFSFGHRL